MSGGSAIRSTKDLGTLTQLDRHDIHADTVLRQQARGCLSVPHVLVAVADDHDTAGGVLRKGRLCQLHGRCQICGIGPQIEQRLQLSQDGQIGIQRRHLDVGIATEDDQCGAVAARIITLRPQRIA